MFKICIWENIASPHHHYFFNALANHPNINLEVRYFEKFHEERVELGWKDNTNLPSYERYVHPSICQALDTLPDWKERIHIVPGISYEFTNKLLDKLLDKNIPWIHWSERSGIGLAYLLRCNVKIFKFLQPRLVRFTKRSYAYKINKYALGAFGQGILAKQDFLNWGIEEKKIEYLFYTIGPMTIPEHQPEEILSIKQYKKFIYAGSLSRCKGTHLLIKVFSLLKNRDHWKLVLVGKDRTNGEFEKMVHDIGLSEQIIFTGPKPIDSISGYIGYSDVFVMPTMYDGWGAVLNEAAVLGKPLIATDQCGSAFHLIEENINGRRVPAGDIIALKNAMQFYVNHPEKIQKHGNRSKILYNKKFTAEKNVERFVSALEKWTR